MDEHDDSRTPAPEGAPGDAARTDLEPEGDESGPAFSIVGIGASAGGLAAFEEFFKGVPASLPCEIAFVLVQHLSPDHPSSLRELIARFTALPVLEVEDAMPVQSGHVYIIPPKWDMELEGGALRLVEQTSHHGVRSPIDHFFSSLARSQRERSACIVLSGTGHDGVLGARAVKSAGGLVLAQEPSTATHAGTPQNTISSGVVDFVLPPGAMFEKLVEYLTRVSVPRAPREQPPAEWSDVVHRTICDLLRARCGHDFTGYKQSTLRRRTQRRMAIQQIDRLADYVRLLGEDAQECNALFRDLLIAVTHFFRDPEAFASLDEKVIAKLVAGKPPGSSLRVWVSGCATGEEAYSIAMPIHERLQATRKSLRVQIFATDLDAQAVDQARKGYYPATIAADISPERLARYFTPTEDGSGFRVIKEIRDWLIFSQHDVFADPPFSRIDLVSCRNLLIYLNPDLQARLLSILHYALEPGGGLFLGPSESLGAAAAHFAPLDRKWKIFRRLPQVARFPQRSFDVNALSWRYAGGTRRPEEGRRPSCREIVEQTLLQHFAPAAVLVNAQGHALHFYGRTGRYLEPAPGDASVDILAMARGGLRQELWGALHRASTSREVVDCPGLVVSTNGGEAIVDLTVMPVDWPEAMPQMTEAPLLVIFDERTPGRASLKGAREATGAAGEEARVPSQDVAALEEQLRARDEYLQTTIEELETANEELKSTNEELQSVNEELQSANEELETSKEELQSMNEELATVNAELQSKMSDLARLNNDMNNLLSGTGVATLFVDLQLRILRFTPDLARIINLIPTDVGRPVSDIASNLVGYDRLTEDVTAVIDLLAPREREVQTRDGAWHLMRIRPYRTLDNKIEGAVITFVDISERKRMEDICAAQIHELTQVTSCYDNAPVGLAVLDRELRFERVNAAFAEITGVGVTEHLGRSVRDIAPPLWQKVREITQRIRETGQPVTDLEVEGEARARPGVRRVWIESWFPLTDRRGDLSGYSVVVRDVTEQRRVEAELRERERQLVLDIEVMGEMQGIWELFTRGADRQVMLDAILSVAIRIGDADMGNIQILDPTSGCLKIVAQRGFDRAFLDFWACVREEQGACGAALARGERVIVSDVAESPIFAGTPALAVLRQAGVRAVQSTPIVNRAGRLIGVFSTHRRTPGRPDERALRILDLLARRLADVLDLWRSQPSGGSEEEAHGD